ncbi:hypothetical protein MaudCBS49596_000024 [Microsporum audouinii]
MGDLTFGTRFNCMGSEEHRYVPSLMMSSGQFLYYFGYLPFTKLVRPLILSEILEVFGGKLNDPNYPRKDFMHYLINRKDPETDKGLSREELAAESSLLIAAGSGTTAVAVSGAIFYFLCYLECLTKAITEVRSTFNSIEDIRGSNMVNLVYLRACVDEALRLAPPQTVNLMVEVLKGGLTVDGNYFPQGTTLGVAPYVIHHNMQYYPDPYAFCPERWSSTDKYCSVVTDDEKSTPESVVRGRSTFLAFGYGPRICIGKNLAYLELMLTLATLLFKFDICLPEDKRLREPSGEGDPNNKHPQDDEGTMSISLLIAYCPSRMGLWSNLERGSFPINDN